MESLEELRRRHRIRLIRHAFGIVLQRAPMPEEIDAWLPVLEAGSDAAEILRHLRAGEVRPAEAGNVADCVLSPHARRMFLRLQYAKKAQGFPACLPVQTHTSA